MEVGDSYSWETWSGQKYEGIVVSTEEDDEFYVKCTDGVVRVVGYR
jgi:translation initiation factor IF-1